MDMGMTWHEISTFSPGCLRVSEKSPELQCFSGTVTSLGADPFQDAVPFTYMLTAALVVAFFVSLIYCSIA